MAGCADIRTALGVYVVGAIDPAERVLVEQHVALCRECRAELAALSGIPALLSRVTLEQAQGQPSGIWWSHAAPGGRAEGERASLSGGLPTSADLA